MKSSTAVLVLGFFTLARLAGFRFAFAAALRFFSISRFRFLAMQAV